ncbi:MAG: hypothetical protein ACRC17_11065 [Culicoidibacterales bacterium]
MKRNKPNETEKQQYFYESMSEREQDLFHVIINELMLGNYTLTTSDEKDENGQNYRLLTFDNL